MTRNLFHLNSRIYAVTALFGIAAITSGCNKKDQPPAVAPPVAVLVVQQLAKPVQKPVSSTVRLAPPPVGNQFDFSNKKDPFKPFIVAKTGADLKKALQTGLPIHSFDVSQFKLIGVITGVKENQAMVVDPNGKGYVLKIGMSIGKNDGRITAISTRGVEVLERFKDDNGRVRKENIRITLPRKQ
jgi:type IV pilus assembly protein PilP